MRKISMTILGKDRGYAIGFTMGALFRSIESHAKNTDKKDLEDIIVCTLDNSYV